MRDLGNIVLVLEHAEDTMRVADPVIDLGPEGGHRGDKILFCGTPEALAQEPRSYTGQFLDHPLQQQANPL